MTTVLPNKIIRFLKDHWFSVMMGAIGTFGVVFYTVTATRYSNVFFERNRAYVVGLVFIVLFALTIIIVIYYVERQQSIQKELFRTSAELSSSEQRLRGILEHTNDVIFALDEEGVITFVSPNAARALGYSVEEIMGTHFSWLLTDESRRVASYHFAMAAFGRTESENFDIEVAAADRRKVPMAARATAMRSGGKFMGVMGMLTDMSAARQAEADQVRYARALATLTAIGTSSYPPFDIDDKLVETLVSTLEITGMDAGALYIREEKDQALKLRVSHGLSDDFARAVGGIGVDEVDMVEAAEVSEDFTVFGVSHLPDRVRTAIAREGLEFVCAVPLMTRNRVTGSMIVSSRSESSLTENDASILLNVAQKLAVSLDNSLLLEQLVTSRNQIEATLESLDDPVVVLNVDARVSYVNSSFTRLLGVDRDYAIGSSLYDIIYENIQKFPEFPRERSTLEEQVWKRLREGPTQFEMRVRSGSAARIYRVVVTDIEVDGRVEGYVAVMHDITDYKRLDEMRSDFVAAASHQLRTPLASIVGFGETILHHFDRLDDEEKRDYTAIVVRQARKLASIVNDLLDFSRLEKGELGLEREKIYLPEIAADVVNDFRESNPDHDFSFAFGPDFPTVYADYFKVEHVLNNLVSNAVKYSPEGGTIEIGGRCANGAVEVWVSDQGLGISPDELDKLFARFYRSPPSKVIAQDGTGLGLYIVKMLVEAQGGEVSVESRPGSGSKFKFSLPL